MIKCLLVVLVCILVALGGAIYLDHILSSVKYTVNDSDDFEMMQSGVRQVPSFEELQRVHQSLTERISFDLPLIEYPDKIRSLKDLTDPRKEKHTLLLFGSFT